MSYKIEVEGYTITVELENPSWTPHVLLQDRFGDCIQLKGNQLNAIRAIRRALTDIVDATKRRDGDVFEAARRMTAAAAERIQQLATPEEPCNWCEKPMPTTDAKWSPFCSRACAEADTRDARATAADARAMREEM